MNIGSRLLRAASLPLFVALAVAGAAGESAAQQPGNEASGARYANGACAECHAVAAGATRSPISQAPAFQSVADTPGITATAIVVWLRTPHPSMPNFIIPESDQRDVAAYIVSLRTAR